MRRELAATASKSELEIVIEATEDGRWRVVVDGRQHEVDAVEVHPGTWSLIVDGRSHIVDLDERKRGTAVLVGATDTLVVLEDARRKRLAEAVKRDASSGTGETVRAPIAGKLVKLLVAVGDTVEVGQGVAVLEAMKMENEIKAERGGTVKAVHASAGQSVETQEKLLTLI
jgi:biotin carboxyl carrier protein